jgi:hypothetical protein
MEAAGGWRLAAGGWRLAAGGWRLGVSSPGDGCGSFLRWLRVPDDGRSIPPPSPARRARLATSYLAGPAPHGPRVSPPHGLASNGLAASSHGRKCRLPFSDISPKGHHRDCGLSKPHDSHTTHTGHYTLAHTIKAEISHFRNSLLFVVILPCDYLAEKGPGNARKHGTLPGHSGSAGS